MSSFHVSTQSLCPLSWLYFVSFGMFLMVGALRRCLGILSACLWLDLWLWPWCREIWLGYVVGTTQHHIFISFLLGCQFLQRGIFLISRLENVSLPSSFLEAEWRIELRVWHSLCKRPYNPPRFQYGTSDLCSSLTPETLFTLLRCEKGTAWFCGIRSGIEKVDIH